jgi:hypothetical protein
MSGVNEKYDNFYMYYKLAQSGKTGIIEHRIHESEDKILDDLLTSVLDLTVNISKVTANIVVTANNLILTNQTTERLSKNMNGKIFELSSRKKHYTTILENIALREDDIPVCRNIICCSNKTRFGDIFKLIKLYLSNNINVIVYLDEIDKYYNQVKYIIKHYQNVKFYGLSGTINKKMFADQGGSILFIHQEINHGPNYVGYRDHEVVKIENDNPCETIETILFGIKDKTANILIIPGRTNEEHMSIVHSCVLHGTVAIVMNQHGIIMYTNLRETVNLSKINPNKELCDILRHVRKDYNINTQIVVVASSACGGRGITHQSEDFLYDVGIILQKPTNKEEIYQSVSRLAHNFKYKNKKCIVYITSINDIVARECELKVYVVNEISADNPKISFKEFEKAGKEKVQDPYEKFRHPIIVIDIDKTLKTKKEILHKLGLAPSTRLWNVDSQDKYNKWSIEQLLKKDATSNSTNIKNPKEDNVTIVYRYENKLIISKWGLN